MASQTDRSNGVDERGLRISNSQSFDWLKNRYSALAGWISDTSTYLCAEAICEISDYGDSVGVNLFSDRNIYHIAARTTDGGYLGLTYSTRRTGAGNDLADGGYNQETWDKIVKDMLSCELISLKQRDDPAHED